MKTGVSTASLFMRRNNEDAVPFLAGLGVKTAEVFLTSFSEYESSFGDLLVSRQNGLHVHSVHDLNTHFEPQLFNACDRVREDAFALLRKVMINAQKLGAKYYTFHGIARYKRADRTGENDNFNRFELGFSRILEECKKYGVKLCLENVEWSTYNRPGVFEKISKKLPELHGVLDVKQSRISTYDYRDYLAEMGERIAHVHVSDFNKDGKIRLPGKGDFDFEELIERLKDVNFNGPLIIEVYKDDYENEQDLKTSCDFLDEILYKKGCLD